MALIGQIREKSWLLLVVVGVAMLAFILPWDQIFNGSASRGENLGFGTVNGERVDANAYEQYKNNIAQNMFNSKRQQDPNASLTEQDLKNAETQAWNALVGKMLTTEQYEELGLMVSPYELDGILYGRSGFEPSPIIRQVAVDSNGLFNSARAQQILDQLQMEDPARYQAVVDEIKFNRLNEKYMSMLSYGVKATTLEAKEEYEAGKTVKNVSFIFKRFSEIPSNEIEVSEDELKAYYAEHKNEKKYEQQGTRKVSYFTVPLTPSEDDTISALNNMVQLKNSFENAQNDTLFVQQYMQTPTVEAIKFYPEDSYLNPQQMQQVYPAEMTNLAVGDIVGPISTSTFIGVAKVKEIEEQKQAHVRHILISANKNDEDAYAAAKVKADSIMNVIKEQDNYVEMEAQFNEDPGGKMNHGVYKNFPEGVMVPEFNDFAFNEPVGTIGVVGTSYGYHVVEVVGRRTVPVYGMFAVNRPVTVTSKTVSTRKSEARKLISEINRVVSKLPMEERTAAFDSMVRTLGYTSRLANILDKSPQVTALGVQGENQLIKFVYKEGNEPGMMNPFPIKDDNKYVIAYYSERQENGVAPYESVKERMRYEVVKEKQAEMLMAEFEGKTDLDVAAQELGLKIEQQGITFDATSVTGAGNAPIFVGTVFSGLQDGQTTVAFEGKSGVFMVRVDNTVPAPETTDFSTERKSLQETNRSNITSKYQNALIQKADVVDNRKLNTLGLR